jgi:hypothetical protein
MRILLILILILPFFTQAQKQVLSENAEISVITCGPSQEELYTAFGHSAIRVFDPRYNYDAAYNYGVFDFNQPNFYLNFARGFLYYKLGVYAYQDFQAHYIYKNRYVHEQVLNLTQEQKQKLFDYLQINAKPENQQYRYDYFYNNCATKIRDVIVDALGAETIHFDGSYIKTDYSIRELTDLYLAEQPWGDLGIDIGLGLAIDKKASPEEYMFLPDYVESGFDHALIKFNDETLPVVKKKNIIYEVQEADPEKGLPHPLFFFIPLACIAAALTFFDLKRKRISQWFDTLLFGVSGTIGVLLFLLWFFTDHNASARNLNLLWAFPLHLCAVIGFIKNYQWLRNYFLFALILSVGLLIFWKFLPQQLHYALIPVVISQALRSFIHFKIRSSRQKEVATAYPVI